MTDQTTNEDAQNPTATETDQPEGSEPDPRNHEAAGWRRKLRDAEAELEAVTAERDALQEQITEARHDKVRSALEEALRGLSDEGVATVVGAADPEKFLDDQGEVNTDAVRAYTAPFQGPASRGPRHKRAWQTGPRAANAPSSSAGASWGSVVRPE